MVMILRRRAAVLAGVLLGLAAMPDMASAGGGTVHIYGVSQRGRVLLGGTLLDRLPGQFNPSNFENAAGRQRWMDIVVDGSDRYALRLNGVIDLNGAPSPFADLDLPAGSGAAWFRLDVDGASVAAIRTDGLLSVVGVPDEAPFDRDKFYFSDLARLNGQWYALRTDGSVFQFQQVDKESPCLKFTGDTSQGGTEGRSSNAEWLVLEADTSTSELVALRSDGQVFRGDPSACGPMNEAMLDAMLEFGGFGSELYVDLEVLADGSYYALRGNGALYHSDLMIDPDDDGLLTDLPGNGRGRGAQYLDVEELNGDVWCLRGDGKIYRGVALMADEKHVPVLDLPRNDHVRLAVSTDAPDTTNAVVYDPVAAVYRARVVEGTTLTIPMLVTDVDTLFDDLDLEVPDIGELPMELNAIWDKGAGTVTVSPALGERGRHHFTLTVDEDITDPDSRLHDFRYTIDVIRADVDPTGERPPALSRVRSVQALVGVPLDLPILVADPDGDTPVLSADTELPAGATFDAMTGVLSWTPTLDQVGRTRIRFRADDGARSRQTRVRIDVINPIVFD